MNSTIKTQWIAALRSGDYKQGRSFLRKGNHYCCLGVLCDLHSKANPDYRESWRLVPYYGAEDCYSYGEGTTTSNECLATLLPNVVQRWAGVDHLDPCIVVDNEALILSQLNDRGYTFEQIAKHIEEQL